MRTAKIPLLSLVSVALLSACDLLEPFPVYEPITLRVQGTVTGRAPLENGVVTIYSDPPSYFSEGEGRAHTTVDSNGFYSIQYTIPDEFKSKGIDWTVGAVADGYDEEFLEIRRVSYLQECNLRLTLLPRYLHDLEGMWRGVWTWAKTGIHTSLTLLFDGGGHLTATFPSTGDTCCVTFHTQGMFSFRGQGILDTLTVDWRLDLIHTTYHLTGSVYSAVTAERIADLDVFKQGSPTP